MKTELPSKDSIKLRIQNTRKKNLKSKFKLTSLKFFTLTLFFTLSLIPQITTSQSEVETGNALNFSPDDYILVSNPENFDVGANTSFTFEAVIRSSFNVPQSRCLFSKMVENFNPSQTITGYQIWAFNGKLRLEWAVDGTINNIDGVTIITDAECHHVAVVVDRSTQNVKLYVDGILEGEVTHPRYGVNIDNIAPVYIGRERQAFFGNFWYGEMDEVSFFTRARTAVEIAQSATTALTGTETDLLSYWKLDSGVDGADNTAVTTAIDEIGNNNGTLINFDLTGTQVVANASNGPEVIGTWIEASCSLLVAVTDVSPTITCQRGIIVNALPNQCSAIVSFNATATGDPTPIITYEPASGSLFPIGTTQVTATATNVAGSTSCTFEVVVQDRETPVVTCAPNIIVNADAEICGATNILLESPTVTDNCSKTGNALDFDGLANGLNIPDFTPTLLSAGGATISAWIYPRTANPAFPDIDFLKDIFKINTWQHIALSFDGTTLKVYHNGALIGSVVSNVDIVTLYATLDLGQLASDNSPFALDGKLDEVRVWNTIRTQEEIQNNMNREIDAQPGLIALYHFNQGIAGGDNTGLTTAVDDSGNGYDITLNNFTLTGATSNWAEGKTFNGVTLTNDAPSDYTPTVYNFGDTTVTWAGTNTAVYPLGDTIVTWTAKDAAGNTETCTQTVTVSLDTYTWNGAIDSDWTNTGNWQDALAPSLSVTSSVTIPAGVPNYPVLTTGQNLTLSQCSTLTVESNASLTINSNAVLTNNGTVTNDGVVTFESDTTGSAYIGEGSGAFNGDFTVERHIPAKRAFRFLSTPVTTTNFIANNWQQDTHITGSTAGSNGFDATNTGNPSMYTFNNSNQTWNAISNTDATNLTSGTPYRLLVRGDRTIDLTNNAPAPTPTTLVSKGELSAENAGSNTVALNESAGGFSLIGNPFQAQVDMQSVMNNNTTNVNPNFYWAWDPNLNVRGAYTTVFLPLGQSTGGSTANNQLQAGQGCFVSTINTGSASLTFNQSNKVIGQVETDLFKSSGKSKIASTGQLDINLYESIAFAENGVAADGVLILFDDAGNNAVDFSDAIKFANLDENLATNINGDLLSIDNRATPFVPDEIQLEINTYRHTDYVLVATAIALQGDTPFLVDAYLDQTIGVLQNGDTPYAYSIDTNIPASYASDRFKIIFQKTLSVENTELSEILLYPNPTNTGSFHLNIPQGIDDLEVTIYNSLGAKLYYNNRFESGRKVSIDTNFTSSQGVYFVELSSEGTKTTKKLVIK